MRLLSHSCRVCLIRDELAIYKPAKRQMRRWRRILHICSSYWLLANLSSTYFSHVAKFSSSSSSSSCLSISSLHLHAPTDSHRNIHAHTADTACTRTDTYSTTTTTTQLLIFAILGYSGRLALQSQRSVLVSLQEATLLLWPVWTCSLFHFNSSCSSCSSISSVLLLFWTLIVVEIVL